MALLFLRRRLGGLGDTAARYPLTGAFLAAAAVLISISIGGCDGLIKYTLSCAVGAAACAAAQSAYERFFAGGLRRAALQILGVAAAALFYLSIAGLSDNGRELPIRAAVTLFALFSAYMWLPVIGSDLSFNDSFMASFKALFQAVFFAGVIFLGCAAVLAATDTLITPVDSEAYAHAANIIFVLFAPLFYLSLIPVFPGADGDGPGGDARKALRDKRIACPRFLEALLSYIIIPLTAIFTVIVLIYIALNIGGPFWTDNLLEPMLIAYTVTVIAVTLLSAGLKNKFAVAFKRIFPKVLIPIALFQVTASLLLMAETGVTHGRYYVILYGVFAVAAGCILSLLPLRKSGVAAAILVALSVISVVPPVDAFSVSRLSQIHTLESVLAQNGMLPGDTLRPGSGVSGADQKTIVASLQYLNFADSLHHLKWLPGSFNVYDENAFFSLFGFYPYAASQPGPRYISVYYDMADLVPVAGYDHFAQLDIQTGSGTAESRAFTAGDAAYTLRTGGREARRALSVSRDGGPELLRFDTGEIFSRFAGYSSDRSVLTLEEAVFTAENDACAMKVIVAHASLTDDPDADDAYAQLFIFVTVK